MGWETRERGGSYYTRSQRDGGRVVREYVGGGLAAELAAEADRIARERRELEALKEKQERERLERSAAFLCELDEAAEVLARAHLVASGFKYRKGEWRRVRERA